MVFDKKTRLKIYEAIKKQGDFLGTYSREQGIMSFLSLIWPLRAMKSEDARFKNAYDDAFQHLVNNNDWDEDQTYLKRFELIDGDEEHFINFVELVVHPETRGNLEEIQRYTQAINEQLSGAREVLIVTDYYNELPIYKFGEKGTDIQRALTIDPNNIPFYKENAENIVYPCFILSIKEWDDYGYETTFFLTFKRDSITKSDIGTVKIMRLNSAKTREVMDYHFLDLNNEFCSLGQSKTYYLNLKNLFPERYQSILLALRDVALFPRIYETFEKNQVYLNSLIRENEAEKLRRNIRRELLSSEHGFKFSYIFKPFYTDGDDGFINLFFNFENNQQFPQRIVALIGKKRSWKDPNS